MAAPYPKGGQVVGESFFKKRQQGLEKCFQNNSRKNEVELHS
jgi:hypothetical protein